MELKTKCHNTEVKQAPGGDERVLRFVASDETPDRDNDIIEVAGWELDNFNKNPVFLFGHKYDSAPIGKAVRCEKDLRQRKLFIDVRFPTIQEMHPEGEPSEHAKFVETVFNLYKLGVLNAVSVGCMYKKFDIRNDAAVADMPNWQRGNLVKSAELYELSGVAVPANPQALQTMSATKGIDESALKVIQGMVEKTAEAKTNKAENSETQKTGRRLSSYTMSLIDAVEKTVKEMAEAMEALKACHEKSLKCLKELRDGGESEEPDDDDDEVMIEITSEERNTKE